MVITHPYAKLHGKCPMLSRVKQKNHFQINFSKFFTKEIKFEYEIFTILKKTERDRNI